MDGRVAGLVVALPNEGRETSGRCADGLETLGLPVLGRDIVGRDMEGREVLGRDMLERAPPPPTLAMEGRAPLPPRCAWTSEVNKATERTAAMATAAAR